DLRRPVNGRADGHVDDALTDGGEFARLVALYQRRAGIDFDVDSAIGALAYQVGPDHGALAPRETRADDDGELGFRFVVFLRMRWREGQRGCRTQGGAD